MFFGFYRYSKLTLRQVVALILTVSLSVSLSVSLACTAVQIKSTIVITRLRAIWGVILSTFGPLTSGFISGYLSTITFVYVRGFTHKNGTTHVFLIEIRRAPPVYRVHVYFNGVSGH